MKTLFLTLLLYFNLTSVSYASTGCIDIGFGTTYCAPANGSIHKALDGWGVVCGEGECVERGYKYICSKEPGGYAVQPASAMMSVKCTGGCESAKKSLCRKL